MPNHWHFVVRPQTDSQLSDFFRWLTHTHTMRWHAHYHTEGTGHLYQGRFKTFPIEADDHLLTVLRYVERNPLRAGLCERAEDWQFGSLWRRRYGTPEQQSVLSDWPVTRPRQWLAHVNRAQSEAELAALRPKRCSVWQQRFRQPVGRAPATGTHSAATWTTAGRMRSAPSEPGLLCARLPQATRSSLKWLIVPTGLPLPRQWRSHVNKPQTEAEVAAVRNCIRRSTPFGTDAWRRSSAVRLGLESTLRPRGRPMKSSNKETWQLAEDISQAALRRLRRVTGLHEPLLVVCHAGA